MGVGVDVGAGTTRGFQLTAMALQEAVRRSFLRLWSELGKVLEMRPPPKGWENPLHILGLQDTWMCGWPKKAQRERKTKRDLKMAELGLHFQPQQRVEAGRAQSVWVQPLPKSRADHWATQTQEQPLCSWLKHNNRNKQTDQRCKWLHTQGETRAHRRSPGNFQNKPNQTFVFPNCGHVPFSSLILTAKHSADGATQDYPQKVLHPACPRFEDGIQT